MLEIDNPDFHCFIYSNCRLPFSLMPREAYGIVCRQENINLVGPKCATCGVVSRHRSSTWSRARATSLEFDIEETAPTSLSRAPGAERRTSQGYVDLPVRNPQGEFRRSWSSLHWDTMAGDVQRASLQRSVPCSLKYVQKRHRQK
uniref:Uncharacterized protein n=1 Tax=Timema poppense TaxID=170557 RepID=A0A7R9HCW4_TIMPO|nr:unnamed protein product [Timema poppensis]